MQVTQNIKLNIYQTSEYLHVSAKQADDNSRFLRITFTDGKNDLPVPSSAIVSLRALKPDKTSILDSGVVNEDGTVTVELTDQVLAVEGIVRADVMTSQGGEILSTATFLIRVGAVPIGTEVVSSNEFLQLVELYEEISELMPVDTDNIVDGAVTTPKLADDAVTSGKIADGAVGTDNLADGAVTNAKIAEGTITGNKFVPALPITEVKATTSGAKYEQSVTTKLGVTHTALLVTSDHYQNALGAVAFSTTATYAVGDYVVYNKKIYKCINAHSGAWEDADFEETKVLPRLDDVEENVTTINSELTNKADAISNTASGAIASFTDGADDLPMNSVLCHIEPTQSGSGDPSPSNVRPISGYTGIEVYQRGFNQWDEQLEVGGINDSTGEKADASIQRRSVNYIPCIPNTEYYIYNNQTASNTSVYVYYYDADKTFLGRAIYGSSYNVNSKIITTPSACAFLLFKMQSNMDYSLNKVCINISDPTKNGQYAPYNGTTYDITFPTEAGTVYGGTLDAVSGLLTVDRAMVDLGSYNWIDYSTPESHIFRAWFENNRTNHNPSSTCGAICEKYKEMAYTPISASNNGYFAITPNNTSFQNRLVIIDHNYSDASAFAESVNGVKLVYPIINPTTYQLTPTEVKSLLGANNLWHSDNGNTDTEYRADTKLYIDNKFAELQALILEN